MTKLKLFVWESFDPDYTDGLAFAIAKTENDARKAVIDDMGYSPNSWGDLQILDLETPCVFSVTGGS